MTKCKHEWAYVGNFNIGDDPVFCLRPKYAKWICPYCEEEKLIELRDGMTE